MSALSPPATPQLPQSRGTLYWFFFGAFNALSVPGLVLFASYLGFGGLIQGVGFPLLAGFLSTLLVWALPAQVILIGGLSSGTALPAIALAVGLSSLRLLPMVVSLTPYMRGSRRNVWGELWCAHYVAMSVWVEGLRLYPKVPLDFRLPFTLGLGNGFLAIAMFGTVTGFFMAAELVPPLAAGLLFLTPLSFTILMIRGARDTTDWLALAAGLGTAPLVAGMSGGMDLMISGIGGGTFAYLAARMLKRRRA